MWLPEMAVDMETLDVLADHGIQFTILSPHQASKVLKVHGDTWTDLPGSNIDTTVPYLCRLPTGREISIFFDDDRIGLQVSFGTLLQNGDRFAQFLFVRRARKRPCAFCDRR